MRLWQALQTIQAARVLRLPDFDRSLLVCLTQQILLFPLLDPLRVELLDSIHYQLDVTEEMVERDSCLSN